MTDEEIDARVDAVIEKVDEMAASFARPDHEVSERVRNHPLFTPKQRAIRRDYMREELRKTLRSYVMRKKVRADDFRARPGVTNAHINDGFPRPEKSAQ